MKKTVTLTLTCALMAVMLTACAGTGTSGAADASSTGAASETKGNYSDEMKLDYAVDISAEDGADSVERMGDHEGSPYFSQLDFYNMTSTDTLTILTGFQTIQQTSEWSCGVTAALMVLNYYDALGDWNEQTLADLRRESDEAGTSLIQAMDIFDAVGGFHYDTTYDYMDGDWNFTDYPTLETIQNYLKNGTPVMICWNDWGGHWQVIIGYDTMGTETVQDDVLIVADPYDTTDHNQDGYGVYAAERFYYNWTMYNFFENEPNDMLFLAAVPAQD